MDQMVLRGMQHCSHDVSESMAMLAGVWLSVIFVQGMRDVHSFRRLASLSPLGQIERDGKKPSTCVPVVRAKETSKLRGFRRAAVGQANRAAGVRGDIPG